MALLVVFATLAAASTALASAGSRFPHVERSGDRRYIADERNREILLRGINSNALVQYPDYFQQTVPMHRSDLEEMAALGFNFLRLPINWSLLAPSPGAISKEYLKRIGRIVGWAQDEGIRVLIDFHQDRYNRNLRPGDEADGAPDWATLTDGQPCEVSFFTSPCSRAAYDNFWNNAEVHGKPLQAHYLDALLAVSRYLRDDRKLLGIELMNEPTFGSTNSPDFEREQLWPFYERMIKGLRRDGERRMIWFEPSILRDVVDFDPGQPERFSRDRNLVYAPHIYTGTFNGGGLPELQSSIAAADREARAYGAAWVDGEWGGGSDEAAETLRGQKLDLLDEYRAGSGFWMWKQRPGFYNWQTVGVDGELRDDSLRAQQLSRPHVDAVPGELLSTQLEDGTLTTRLRGPGGRARFWSGTVVESGGTNLLPEALTRVSIDGRKVRSRARLREFESGDTSLTGYRVSIDVPRGTHTVKLKP
jgi:endoglycosylceramidase